MADRPTRRRTPVLGPRTSRARLAPLRRPGVGPLGAGLLLALATGAAGVGPVAPLTRTPDALIGAPQVAAGYVGLVMLPLFFAGQLALVLVVIGAARWARAGGRTPRPREDG